MISQDDKITAQRWANAILTATLHDDCETAANLATEATDLGVLSLVALATAALRVAATTGGTEPSTMIQAHALDRELDLN